MARLAEVAQTNKIRRKIEEKKAKSALKLNFDDRKYLQIVKTPTPKTATKKKPKSMPIGKHRATVKPVANPFIFGREQFKV
jgi:hypothetical protein